MSSKQFKPLETIRKHRLDKATLEVTKAQARVAEAEANVHRAQAWVAAGQNALQGAYHALANSPSSEFIEIVRIRYQIDDIRTEIAQAQQAVKAAMADVSETRKALDEARKDYAKKQRSLDAMEVIINRMKDEEAEEALAREEDLMEDLTLARRKSPQ